MLSSYALRRLLQVAVISAVLTALCILVLDQPFARWLATRETYPPLWNEPIRVLEYAIAIEPNKWIGVYLLVIGSFATLFMRELRSYAGVIVLVTLTHLLARNASWLVKWLTGRLRPSQWIKAGGDDTFFRDGFSFPSGHVLLFASIVLPIVVAYPRARPLLAIVAFVMIARVAVNAHFLSDVLAGLAVTALFTWLAALLVRRALPSQSRPASLQ